MLRAATATSTRITARAPPLPLAHQLQHVLRQGLHVRRMARGAQEHRQQPVETPQRAAQQLRPRAGHARHAHGDRGGGELQRRAAEAHEAAEAVGRLLDTQENLHISVRFTSIYIHFDANGGHHRHI